MYLADEPLTAIAEVRANVNEAVTVASFKTIKPLDFLILKHGGAYGGKTDDEFEAPDVAGFIMFLGQAYAWPIQGQAEIEYSPTQFFSAYCKSKGLAGIQYISSARGFHGNGGPLNHFNYVLFDDADVSFVEAHRYKVNAIQYTVEQECSIVLKGEGEK